ncbi:MAG TPA: chemotaxis protein CheC [Verrucomicrobiae bacterium]|nr:chemotaxis protein CheC [Verrucomicrobiae bacterium]
MDLTERQNEALTELINIGYGRAAAALSELTGRRIALEVPKVAVHPIQRVREALGEVLQGEVASVHQVFSGPVSGNALLLLDQDAAVLLNSLLLNSPLHAGRLRAAEREALTEVGNIVLNACLGVFGNLLQVQVTFAVPRLDVESVEGVLQSISVRSQELQYALMVHTRFSVRDSDIQGYLVIILGITSFSRLLQELDKWEKRQLQC